MAARLIAPRHGRRRSRRSGASCALRGPAALLVGRACARCARAPRPSRRRCRGAWCGASRWSGPWALRSLVAGPAFSMMWAAGSKPGIGTSSGKPANAARGARPTSSARGHRRRGRATASTTARSGVATGSSTLNDTWARARVVEPEPDRPHAGQALGAALADRARRSSGRSRRSPGGELDVEGDERRAGGDQRGAGGRVGARRAEVGLRARPTRAGRPGSAPPRRSSARVRPSASAP